MVKILIVDDDLGFQRILGISLQKNKNDFEVMLANNGEEAINVLQNHDIALLVTDIQMPRLDGLGLLAYVSEHKPKMPYIVMTAHSTAAIEANFTAIGPRFLKKPFSINTLVDAVIQALQPARPDGSLQGISVANFLQMIEMEQKTCLLEITSPRGDTGLLYLEHGELFDAVYQNLEGEAAAFELIAMDEARISFGDIPEQSVGNRINASLMGLIMEALKRKDEAHDQD